MPPETYSDTSIIRLLCAWVKWSNDIICQHISPALTLLYLTSRPSRCPGIQTRSVLTLVGSLVLVDILFQNADANEGIFGLLNDRNRSRIWGKGEMVLAALNSECTRMEPCRRLCETQNLERAKRTNLSHALIGIEENEYFVDKIRY